MDSRYVLEVIFKNSDWRRGFIACENFNSACNRAEQTCEMEQNVAEVKVLFRKTNRCLRKFVR